MSFVDNNNLPNLLYVLSSVFVVLPTIVVVLRFRVKTRTNPKIFLDDWAILFALLSCIIYAVSIIIGVAAGGLGRPLKRDIVGEPIYDDKFFIFKRASYVTNAVQISALGPTKLSVLLFYRRVFGVEKRCFNIMSITLMTLVTIWTIGFFFTNIFSYTPVSDFWTKPPGESHRSFDHVTEMFNAQCFADMTLDIFIVILPLPQIWKLQMPTRVKVQVSSIFLLGLITIGASAARAVIQYGVAAEFETGNLDQTYYLAPGIYWALLEVSLGIIAASLPLLRPIVRIHYIREIILSSAKTLSSIFTSSSPTISHGDSRNHDIESAPHLNHQDSLQDNKRASPYDLSCLQETVNNDIESDYDQMSITLENYLSSDINCEKGVYGSEPLENWTPLGPSS
ncbi:hypothetical protein GGS24DRAFT_478871 [Hypoxylon argillaceum]|nr:hypothetical protein GGS24DRAFT_478871 [Hypoxylon argillaceum]KAI1149036.1 hypothetical protein F4825DRAFT_469620 [Nemania diffusa]